jgi:uncharacterized protein (TIGR02680 family)
VSVAVELPSAAPGRWRPLRIGLLDLFYYDIEEFHFHGGNLLLRGNNGTGKSKVLALTMPFLLDGELAPHRVEPDGDRTKKMEWNLLLGGRYEHSERIGYTWMELGRREADGTEQFTTIGCGLKAAAGRGIVRHWFFVTSQRIGPQLSLLTPARTSLTRERLKEAIGERGMVYDRAVDYRRAVDEALFGLGARYDTLVSLLIQLRAPQLTKRPDEKLLSHALTDALPPLDENLITQVAEAFRGLDDERVALDGLNEVRTAATQFLVVYSRYARTAAKRKAFAPRRTHSQYEDFSQQLTAAHRDLAQAEQNLTIATEKLRELATRRSQLEARQLALQESPEARSREELGRANEWANQLAATAKGREQEARRAGSEASRWRHTVEERTRAVETTIKGVEEAASSATRAAAAARVAVRHQSSVVDVLATPDAEPRAYPRARRAGDETVQWRRQTIERLESLVGRAESEAVKLAHAQADEDGRRSEAADAAARVTAADHGVGTAAQALVAALHAYFSRLVLVRLADPATLLSTVEDWAASQEGDNPATRTVHDAADAVTRDLATARADTRRERDAASAEIKRIDAELTALRQGGHPTPPVTHTRTAQTRTGRPGAALWQVTEFAESVPEADRAGIEAALEASGLLDAWVSPDGALLGPDDDDVLVVARTASGVGLDAVLFPAINPADAAAAALSPGTVAGVLAGIGLGSQSTVDTWVAQDGTFRVGALEGRWRKRAATYIGEGAREAARQARIEELSQEQEFQEMVVADCESRIAELDAQLAAVGDERAALPGDSALREAHTTARLARQARQRAEQAVGAAVQRVAAARLAANAATAAVAEFAGDVDLPADRSDLAQVRGGLQDYAIALTALWPALTAQDAARAALAGAEAELTLALDHLEEATGEHQDAQERAVAARERYKTLESTVGVAVKELQRRLDEVAGEMSERHLVEDFTRKAEGEARTREGIARGRIETLTAALSSIEEDRRSAVEALRSFAATGLLRLACPDVEVPDPTAEWAPTPAVVLARAIDRHLSDVDDTDRRWELDQQAVSNGHKILADGLSRHGHRASLAVRDDAMLVEVSFQGRTQRVAELSAALDDEIAERERILSTRHREILENQLVSEVAASLQELVSAAEVQVKDMNQELAARPTSTGMKLRLVWRVASDAPAGLAALRDKLLRQSADVWTEEDRLRLGDFLEEQIRAERLRDSSATWVEQLTNALDYRSWHDFAIQRHQDGQWRSATGPASGGERVLAASVPLFAAASSYYASSGNPNAPRLIALDEAFAGVDDDSRAKCLGLLATFDLDVMMTSEREWGCYPQVPGLAIAQLARRDGIDAVLVTPWRWDGNVRVPVPRPEPFVSAPTAVPASDQPDLFA